MHEKWNQWVSIHRDFIGIVMKTAQWMLNTVSCHWCILCPQAVVNCNCMAVCWSSNLQHKLQLLWWKHIETNWRETTVCGFWFFFPDDWGLEVCGHGGGPYVPVDLRHRVCGGNPGLISPTCLPESHHSHSAAQLRQASYMRSSKACVPEDYYHQSCWHCDSIVRPRRQATKTYFKVFSKPECQAGAFKMHALTQIIGERVKKRLRMTDLGWMYTRICSRRDDEHITAARCLSACVGFISNCQAEKWNLTCD